MNKEKKSEIDNLIIFWNRFKENFRDLKDFIDWFYRKLNIHYFKRRDGRKFKQFQIYYFDLGKNIGGETNKKRPILILGKTTNFISSKTVLGAVITSLYDSKGNKKTLGKMDVLIKASPINGLKNDSIIKLGKIMEIDKKRVLGYFGKIDNSLGEQIFEKLKEVFGIKK